MRRRPFRRRRRRCATTKETKNLMGIGYTMQQNRMTPKLKQLATHTSESLRNLFSIWYVSKSRGAAFGGLLRDCNDTLKTADIASPNLLLMRLDLLGFMRKLTVLYLHVTKKTGEKLKVGGILSEILRSNSLRTFSLMLDDPEPDEQELAGEDIFSMIGCSRSDSQLTISTPFMRGLSISADHWKICLSQPQGNPKSAFFLFQGKQTSRHFCRMYFPLVAIL